LSPTVAMEPMFITAAITASKKCHVCCYNIPSAFVNTDVNEDMLMVLKGETAEMMVNIAPQIFRRYITVDKAGTKVLYVKLQKALYGLMRASLFFYKNLRKELENFGFMINLYDPSMANKDGVNKEQLMVIWNLDDLMASCNDNFKFTKLLCYLAKLYGPKLTMDMEQKHDYLGVDVEFQEDKRLRVMMVKYPANVIDSFTEQIVGNAATPGAERVVDIWNKRQGL
jgi:hypothetical protein